MLFVKLEEIYAPELNDFVYITDNAYTHAEVRAMELNIFKVTITYSHRRASRLKFSGKA